MGQKVSPIGFRTGVTVDWKSRWYAPKSNYGEFVVEDERIRRFVDDRLNRQPPYAAIASIEIERTREEVKVVLRTARPGLVIGPKGAEVDKLKGALEDLTDRRVNINIVEVKNPDLDAQLVAEGIAEQLKRRSSFRRTVKQRAESAMQAGAKGVKIIIAGRLGGAEMSRTESQIQGSIPLHTLEADVDYGFVPSFTTYGAIGVKVWIYRGMFGEQPSEEEQSRSAAMTRARRRRERTGRGGGRGRGGRGGRQDVSPVSSAIRPGGSRLGGQERTAEADQQKSEQAPEQGEPAQAEQAPPAESQSQPPAEQKSEGESQQSGGEGSTEQSKE
jgi:small subunit ribosomal protein S3